MPSLKDPEIKELVKLVDSGVVKATADVGYLQVCDQVPSIKRACASPAYRDCFINWWSKYKQKRNATQYLTPKIVKAPLKSNPTPSVPSPDGTEPATEIPFSRLPPPKEGPKKRVKNHPRPSPAASPDSSIESTEKFVVPPAIWEPTSPRPSPVARSKSCNRRSTPNPVIRRTPSVKSLLNMNADDQCLDLIKRQLPIPESFLLTEDGSHGIELYVVPWADTSGTKHVTIIVVGAKGAKVLAGGQTIEFTFRRQNSAHLFLHALSAQNSAKLTNPKIREAFNCFSEFYGKMMELRTHRISQTGVYNLYDITGFTSQEEVVTDLWQSGSFPIEGDQVCHITLRDRSARGLNTCTTQYVVAESPHKGVTSLGHYGGGQVPSFATPPHGNFVNSYYGSPAYGPSQMGQHPVAQQQAASSDVLAALQQVTSQLTSLSMQNHQMAQKMSILEAQQLQAAPMSQSLIPSPSQSLIPSPPTRALLNSMSTVTVQTVDESPNKRRHVLNQPLN